MRSHVTYHLEDLESFKKKLLNWSLRFNEISWLDSNNYIEKYSSYDALLAVDAMSFLNTDSVNAFEKLKAYHENIQDWMFGYLTYDLKNDVEDLKSENLDQLEFPDLYFFQPKKIILIKGKQVEFLYNEVCAGEVESDFRAISRTSETLSNHRIDEPVKIKLRIHKDEYFDKLSHILDHIHRGDIYEMNFCQEFYAEQTLINPLETYLKLDAISKPPFASFLKISDKYLMSASPERYLKRSGSKLTSQPIKGTAKRSKDSEEDQAFKKGLKEDEKERSENIMIVDLVRNDLSKTAIKGSVKVEELCEVYTFPQVHQMISTITSEVPESVNSIDLIQSTFPMGSMTGAPKVSAMKIIETYEETKRGLYSGAVGYFKPNGDFDFNVVIRSILFNASRQYVSYSVGGAITAKSDPHKEYEECLVKAKAMREVLEG
ncbi:aminodeoxychorismate synthase component I [Mangrovimonas sp. ST2L15]|uniref:aminodeoxychorismate synthase component I n=1 Tax=Mangrovimonas sp. ST2L15 TaxID=1645916 RepID=UPI0006B5F52D|nr:aminodeoxychorismate synthase component I [Mangrovimonas sp. ST2L15]